jgi:hypothetical protein
VGSLRLERLAAPSSDILRTRQPRHGPGNNRPLGPTWRRWTIGAGVAARDERRSDREHQDAFLATRSAQGARHDGRAGFRADGSAGDRARAPIDAIRWMALPTPAAFRRQDLWDHDTQHSVKEVNSTAQVLRVVVLAWGDAIDTDAGAVLAIGANHEGVTGDCDAGAEEVTHVGI